ncbi:anthranilate synthase component II [Desertivirga brevis]|uniref:anthranilate synthase component II n=1 Tax=Desertivirga brevis TaxID=2810310 RepID=UPI001A95AFED|nr:aminodeoxychorismate/anthranilate synthase component II [Pedobacter sp. SYSU D00873]
MKILVVDNYDSFTFNLVHLLHECGHEPTVWRNDKFELKDVEQFDKILLSPGPGIPSEAGLLQEVIRTYASTKSILGVCLGMQAMGEVFGGNLYNLSYPVHGRATDMQVLDEEESLFKGLPNSFKIGRYHSWAVSREGLPETVKVTAKDAEGVIMALRHVDYDVRGVQFHPESVLTEHGREMIQNWLTQEPQPSDGGAI